MKVRTAAKAIIIEDGRLLCTKNQDEKGIFYMLPGGGQENGENLIETLRRECLEEISAKVIVGEVLFIRDYIEKNHNRKAPDSRFHQLELMFACQLQADTQIGNGANPDPRQVGVEWIDLERLEELRFYPRDLKTALRSPLESLRTEYLGDVN